MNSFSRNFDFFFYFLIYLSALFKVDYFLDL